jgi:CheY-like chemotaxis protein
MSETKRILLAEDSPNDIELMMAALEESQLDNEVDIVRDGVEALNRTTEDWHRGTQAATSRVVKSLNPTVRSFCATSDDKRYSP